MRWARRSSSTRWRPIRARHGPDGVTDFVPVGGEYGKVTDDTQMTLFTVDGLIRAGIRPRHAGSAFDPVGPVHVAYLAWLATQQRLRLDRVDGATGLLLGERWLYARRAPGNTCLSALEARQGQLPYGVRADNDSKGCGAVMRAAPFGLLAPIYRDLPTIFEWSDGVGALTHGHPSGHLSAGALAVIVARLCLGDDLDAALDAALSELGGHEGHVETTQALLAARRLAAEGPSSAEQIERLGGGWVGEEALAIAVYAALVYSGRGQMPRTPCCSRSTTAGTATRRGRSAATSWARLTARRRCRPTGWPKSRAGERSCSSPTTSCSSSSTRTNCTAITDRSPAGATAPDVRPS